MKKYFFTGLITLLPVMITCIIVVWLFNLFTKPFAGIIESLLLSYEHYLGFSVQNHATLTLLLSRIAALLFLLILIFILGFFGQRFFSRLIERLFSHIPFIGTIYKMSHDLTKAVLTDNQKTFKETVLVPFPNPQTHAIGLTTGPIPELFKEILPTGVTLFVPTGPQPTSGFVLMLSKDEVISTKIPTEDAFKFLISCGSMLPSEKKTKN